METLKMILRLLPVLIEVIKTVEQALPEPGQGAVKLEVVKQILTAFDEGVAAIWPAVNKTISAIVAAMNLTGAFK